VRDACHHDVVVVGSGPAGATAALALAREGAQVALIGSPRRGGRSVGETVSPEAASLIARLGLREIFRSTGSIETPGSLASWGGESLRSRDFIFSPHGSGWQVNRPLFDEMLVQSARTAGATWMCGHVAQLRNEDGRWHAIAVTNGHDSVSLAAEHVVWAAGRTVPLPPALPTRRERCDGLVAVSLVHPYQPETGDTRTWIESACDGWWYSSPFPDGSMAFAFLTDADLIPRGNRNSWWQSQFAATSLMRQRIREPHVPRAVFTACAYTARSTSVEGETWILAGDAALSMDPLSSSGIAFALDSGLRAAAAIGSDAGADYSSWVEGVEQSYFRGREYYYNLETKWSESKFWQRRCVAHRAASLQSD
jgi:flavin-dependent dehydrogenase